MPHMLQRLPFKQLIKQYYVFPPLPSAPLFQWYEIDLVYYFICLLQAVGLAWDVRLPSEKDKAIKRKAPVTGAKQAQQQPRPSAPARIARLATRLA